MIEPIKIQTSETLDKDNSDQLQAMVEILARQEVEKYKQSTNPSALALETTMHSSGQGSRNIRKKPQQLFDLYLTNQYIFRAVNVRADTLISSGYTLIDGDDIGTKACQSLIDNSGGENLFWQLSVNTDIAGDGYLEKAINANGTKILKLKHVHPITLRYKTVDNTSSGRIDINKKTKQPKAYTQYYINSDGVEITKDVAIEKIAHFIYNTIGDEFTGVSTIQSGYDTIVRLMNMEYAAAEAAVKTANPMWVGKCNTKSPHQVAQWSTILGNISGKDQIFVPDGMELKMMSPGPQNFSEYSDYFLNAVVATTGVPKAILLGGSSSSNRASEVVLSKHFYTLIRSNQQYMERYFNNIFKEYADLAGFKAPKLKFNDVAEDTILMGDYAVKLFDSGIVDRDEARFMIGLQKSSKTQIFNKEAQAVKESNAETWHNQDGKQPGSQAGEKTAMKQSKDSVVSPMTK